MHCPGSASNRRTGVSRKKKHAKFSEKRKIWLVLFSWNARFEIRPFALLPEFLKTFYFWTLIKLGFLKVASPEGRSILSERNFFNICVLSQCIFYWVNFYISKNINSYTFLLALKIAESLQCILNFLFFRVKTIISFSFFRILMIRVAPFSMT